MYKLVFADDEKFIREGIRDLVDWDQLGFEMVGIFNSGSEVIEFLKNEPVDVVFTDIMMPHVGGMEVAKFVNEYEIVCKVVLLSGYREFEYAMSAIKYGVEDYLLKPTDVEEIKEVFQKIKRELDKQNEDYIFHKELEDKWKEMRPILEEEFVENLIKIGLDNEKTIRRKMSFLFPDLDIFMCPCMLLDVEFENYENYLANKWNYSLEQFEEAVSNFVKIFREYGFFYVLQMDKGKMQIFALLREPQNHIRKYEMICEECEEKFIEEMSGVFQLEISKRAERIFENILSIAEFRKSIGLESEIEASSFLLERKKLIITNIVDGNIVTAQKIFKMVLEDFKDYDIEYAIHFSIELLVGISEVLQENGPDLYHFVRPYLNYQKISSMFSVEDIVAYCNRIFDKMKIYDKNECISEKNGIVDRARRYVEKHIFEDIVIEDVANEVFISTSHFRRIFKRYTGETFLQYVTGKKMEQAALLLADPQFKVYQVGEMLGYRTPSYFAKLFRGFYGYYPEEYRREVLKLTGGRQ